MLKRSLLVLLLASFAASGLSVSAAQPRDSRDKKTAHHAKAKVNAKKTKQTQKVQTKRQKAQGKKQTANANKKG